MAPGMACSGGMEPMQVIWAGMVVVVRAPAGAGAATAPWPGPGRPADHDAILNQVTAWLSGLRQGVEAAPILPALPTTLPAITAAAAPAFPGVDEPDQPLPGFYL